MLYVSTRGHTERKRFCDILLEGLAPDGGLYLPERYPVINANTLAAWRQIYLTQGYADLAFEILSLYIDDIPADDLRALCRKTYTAAVFGSREIVPLKKLEDGFYLQCNCWAICSSTSWPAATKSSTSSAPPVATPAARPNTPCAAKKACVCS
jgi:threonine synthase